MVKNSITNLRDKFRAGVISLFWVGVIGIVGYLMAIVISFPIAYQLGKFGKIVQILVFLLPTILIIIGYIMKKSDEFKKSRAGSMLFYGFSFIFIQLNFTGGAIGSTRYGVRTVYFSWYEKLDSTAQEACQFRSSLTLICFIIILLVCAIVDSIFKKNKTDKI